MDSNVAFSLELLRLARRDAAAYNVTIPKKLTALRSDKKHFFVQGLEDSGEMVEADNAYHARANYISILIERAHPQLEDETVGTH